MSHLSSNNIAIRLFGFDVFTVSIALAFALPGYGQVTPEEHAKHHPGQDKEKDKGGMPGMAPGSKEPAKGMGGGMEDMGKMMENMGKPPPKELYPTLMSLPELTTEQREQVRRQAHERMLSGVGLLSKALESLGKAAEVEDYEAMQEATGQVREAFAQFESGLAARRALAEGKPPRQVAMQWFKAEMNLQPPNGVEARGGGFFGVSWFHLFTMVLLIAFALAMVAMYFFKMRRAAALFGRIESDSGSPPPGSSPPLVAQSAVDAKAAPLKVSRK